MTRGRLALLLLLGVLVWPVIVVAQIVITGLSAGIPQDPVAVTGSSSAITQTTASLAGTGTPNGIPSSGYFQIGTTTGYELPPTAPQALGSGYSPVAIAGGSVTGLLCGTLYHWRAFVDTPGVGTAEGADATFTTDACTVPPTPPVVVTQAATNVNQNSAVLNGTCDPEGTAATARFRCGPSTGSYTGCGNTASPTVSQNVGSGTSPVAVTQAAGSLSASEDYFFRLECTNGGGTTQGSELSFTTSAPPGGRRLLTSTDFNDSHLEGTYDLAWTNNGNANQMCLAHRFVSGQLRLYVMQIGNSNDTIREFTTVGQSFGAVITAPLRQWQNVGGQAQTDWRGCWFDPDVPNKFWTLAFQSYSTPAVTQIYSRILNDDLSVSNVTGPYLLTGVTQKWAGGGMVKIPTANRAALGNHTHLAGWGGGSSTVSAAGGSCLGLCVTAWTPGTMTPNVTSANYLTLARQTFVASDSGAGTTSWRGIRLNSNFQNYQGGNDPRGNPHYGHQITVNVAGDGVTVTCPACSGSGQGSHLGYLNPASGTLSTGGSWWVHNSTNGATVTINGQARSVKSVTASGFVLSSAIAGAPLTGVTMAEMSPRPRYAPLGSLWHTYAPTGNRYVGHHDSYWGSCNWIDEPASYGFLCTNSNIDGKDYYAGSTVWNDGRKSERHFFDPGHFAEVVAGSRNRGNVYPVSMVAIATPGLGTGIQDSAGIIPKAGITGSTWVPQLKKWFDLGCGLTAQPQRCRVYQFAPNVN